MSNACVAFFERLGRRKRLVAVVVDHVVSTDDRFVPLHVLVIYLERGVAGLRGRDRRGAVGLATLGVGRGLIETYRSDLQRVDLLVWYRGISAVSSLMFDPPANTTGRPT